MTEKKPRLLLGAHMSIAGGLEKAITRGESIGCTVIQIFTKSNRQWQAKPITTQEEKIFKKTFEESSLATVIAHASYLINLGSPDKIIQEKSLHALIEELQRCQQLGIRSLVLHPGAYLDGNEKSCINEIARNLDLALEQAPKNVAILLENTAGQGTTVGYTFEQLAEIREKATHKSRIQFCFDTCHAFAAGYQFHTPKDYDALWHEFDRIIGLQHLKALHLNDSQKQVGSHVDRHEHIGKGKLGPEAFRLLCNDLALFGIPKILETPKEDELDDIQNMERIKQMLSEETKKSLHIIEEDE